MVGDAEVVLVYKTHSVGFSHPMNPNGKIMEYKSTDSSDKHHLCGVQKNHQDRTPLCLEGEVSLLPKHRGSLPNRTGAS